jgi:hypothetical protein
MADPRKNDPAIAAAESRLYTEMKLTARAISQAQARRDLTGVRNLRQHFATIAQQYQALGKYEPSAVLSALAKIDEWIEAAARGAWNVAEDLGGTVLDTVKLVPLIIVAVIGLAFFLIAKNPGNFGIKKK